MKGNNGKLFNYTSLTRFERNGRGTMIKASISPDKISELKNQIKLFTAKISHLKPTHIDLDLHIQVNFT